MGVPGDPLEILRRPPRGRDPQVKNRWRRQRGTASHYFFLLKDLLLPLLLTFHIVECLASPTSSLRPLSSFFRTDEVEERRMKRRQGRDSEALFEILLW